MSIERDDVKKVAHLARLAITDDKVDEYTHNLSNILAIVEQMGQVDVSDVTPLSNPLDAVQRLRPDIADKQIEREAWQKVAPETENGLYLVPKVIE